MNPKAQQHVGVIDPDPYTVAMCWIAAAGLALQIIQAARDWHGRGGQAEEPTEHARTNLGRLEDALDDALRQFDLISRTIDRGAQDPDAEFYAAEFRIGAASLRLDRGGHDSFKTQLAETYTKVGALSLWTNNLIGHHPQAAALVGRRMMNQLEGSADHLNSMIRDGAPNRQILAECRLVIETTRHVITALLDKREN